MLRFVLECCQPCYCKKISHNINYVYNQCNILPKGEPLCIGPVPKRGRFLADPVNPKELFSSSATLKKNKLGIGMDLRDKTMVDKLIYIFNDTKKSVSFRLQPVQW